MFLVYLFILLQIKVKWTAALSPKFTNEYFYLSQRTLFFSQTMWNVYCLLCLTQLNTYNELHHFFTSIFLWIHPRAKCCRIGIKRMSTKLQLCLCSTNEPIFGLTFEIITIEVGSTNTLLSCQSRLAIFTHYFTLLNFVDCTTIEINL